MNQRREPVFGVIVLVLVLYFRLWVDLPRTMVQVQVHDTVHLALSEETFCLVMQCIWRVPELDVAPGRCCAPAVTGGGDGDWGVYQTGR